MTRTIPKWNPPARDPSFARWLHGVLTNNYGPPVPAYEILDQLRDETGFSEADLVGVLGYPPDYFTNPDDVEDPGEDGDED